MPLRARQPTSPVVDPAWLLKALALTIGVALLCGYATFCLLFYQGQWQVVLHPTRDRRELVLGSGPGTEVQTVHFGPDASGTPQMVGWWLPATTDGRYRHLTVLYLAGGDGQVATTAAARLADLHSLGMNVFGFDPRGFGESAGGNPDEAHMREDAGTALNYLGSIRGVPASRTILYGAGVGGSLAASLAAANRAIPAIVLDGPEPDVLGVALRDPRARLLPVRLLFHERFPLFPELAGLRTPKLILTRDGAEGPRIAGDQAGAAADPKITVALPHASHEMFTRAVSRFLDQYAPPTPPPLLMPTTAPPLADRSH